MVLQVKAFAAKLADLNSTSRTDMVEGENQLQQIVYWPPLAYCSIWMYLHLNINVIYDNVHVLKELSSQHYDLIAEHFITLEACIA